jgi:hypothetical protein
MSAKLARLRLALLIAVATCFCLPAVNAVPIFGVDTNNKLVRFNSATPGTILSSVTITGTLGGEQITALDFRPSNEQLYGLGSNGRLYVINQVTAVATQVGTGPLSLNGASFGFDFNPTVDRIRITSEGDQNVRVNPNDGSLVATDTPLAYASGDVNVGKNPNVAGSAYTNNFAGATTTTLYGIDAGLDILVTQNPPNAGSLNTVGPLGVDASVFLLGFDIDGVNGIAYASLVVSNICQLYTINLSTGAATLVGTIGGGSSLRGIAVVPPGVTAALAGTTATFSGSDANNTIIFDQSGGLLRHNRFSLGDRGFNSDFDFDPGTAGDQTLSASDPAVTIVVNAGAGDDTVVIGTNASPASTLAASFQINGQSGGDKLVINDSADATGRTITLNSTTSKITGIGGPITHGTLESITLHAGTGADTINIVGTSAAATLTSILAGGGDDKIVFGNGATLSGGYIDGGPGTNTLDYSSYTTPVAVDFQTTNQLLLALLSGPQEAGPLSNSQALGRGVFLLNAAQTALTFNIAYSGVSGPSITGDHFQNQAAGLNGPIVRGLFSSEENGLTTPSGTFTGVWSTSDPALDPPNSSAPIRPLNAPSPVTPGSTLLQELLAGRIYFEIHTPSFSSGEIRGQLNLIGAFNPATGTSGVANFSNLIYPTATNGIHLLKLTNGSNNDAGPGLSVPAGSTVTFTYIVTNPGQNPLSSVTVLDDNGTPGSSGDDFFATYTGGDANSNGVLEPNETWTFSATRTATAGQYTNVGTATGTPNVGPVVSDSDSENYFGQTPQPLNISTRLRVLTGDNALIGGFIITGSAQKNVIVRAIGPSLANAGVSDALADPVLELNKSGTVVGSNDNWRESQEADIQATGIPPQSELESALITTLNPAAYTAIVRGRDGGTGVGLVEVYDLNYAVDSQLANISTRGFVDTGANVMIGGFILGGNSGTTRIAVRGIGPSLTGAGVPNALADPNLDLRDSNGVRVAFNDNWMDDSAQAAQLSGFGLSPSDALESGLVTVLPPGAFTAILSGNNGGVGVGLVEVYNLK